MVKTTSPEEKELLRDDLVRAQLEQILVSTDFVRAERMSGFLRFIVEEALEGRANRLKAFTIAQEVFGRDETFDPRTDTIVRVEAGALRRRLEHYYLTAGHADPIVIDVPKGAYVPVFNARVTDTAQPVLVPASPATHSMIETVVANTRLIVAALVLLLAAGIAWWWMPEAPTVVATVDEHDRLYQRHTSNPEAYALYLQADLLTYPPSNETRVLTASTLFEEVVVLDPGFAGGYTGLGKIHMINVMFGHSETPRHELEQAIELLQKAIALDPSFAAAYAWLASAYVTDKKPDQALKFARDAVRLRPDDPMAQSWLGNSLVLTGESEEGIVHIKEALRLDPTEPRTPYLNFLGIAYFNAGRYRETIETIERNNRRGGPLGPHMDIFLVAAYAVLGQDDKARSALRGLLQEPTFPVTRWLGQWIVSAAERQRVLATLQRLGWTAS